MDYKPVSLHFSILTVCLNPLLSAVFRLSVSERFHCEILTSVDISAPALNTVLCTVQYVSHFCRWSFLSVHCVHIQPPVCSVCPCVQY